MSHFHVQMSMSMSNFWYPTSHTMPMSHVLTAEDPENSLSAAGVWLWSSQNLLCVLKLCSWVMFLEEIVSCHGLHRWYDKYLYNVDIKPQVYTYVTDNAYVCLTVCLTGNEELFQ